MRKFLKNQKGITMMEVLVTVALLAIVVVPCLSSFIVAQRGNVLAEQTYNEYTKASNLMEHLKSLSADKVEDELEKIKADRQDGIDVVYEYNSTDDYYQVTVLVGEPEDGQENSDGKIILVGVITP